MSKRKGWYDRIEVKRVTLDWVKTNVRLTDREIELLKIINYRKLVRRDMLEIISPSYRYLNIKNRTRIINKSINKMFNSMVIDKVHEPQRFKQGNTPAVVALDRAGSLILGVPFKQRIKQNRHVLNGVEYIHRQLPSNFYHINRVNQLEVDTILFCEETGNKLSKWILEKPIKLLYGQDRIVLIPDVLLELKFKNKTVFAFLEYDTGSENLRYKEPPIIREKIIKYKKYMMSKLWEKEFPNFPLLIFVTEDLDRVDFFNKKCEENGIFGIGVYYKNYKELLYSLNYFFSR